MNPIVLPGLFQEDAPAGFRAVSPSQGMLEYAQPLLDCAGTNQIEDLNLVLQLVMLIWNYDISIEQGHVKMEKKEIIQAITETLDISLEESAALFEKMVQRKEYLFPKEIQPVPPMTLFMRKEKLYLIAEFNYNSINLSDLAYVPDNKDKKLVLLLDQLDQFIDEGAEYEEWEDHYFEALKACKKRYENWLKFKGIRKYLKDFPFNIEIYLDFIYRYGHEDELILKTVAWAYIEEFFMNHLLRKAVVEPHEYVFWPPALKLFYQFLKEIDYFERPEKIIKLFDEIEPHFINLLREIYS